MPGDTWSASPWSVSSPSFNGAPGSCLGIRDRVRFGGRPYLGLQWSPRFMPGDTTIRRSSCRCTSGCFNGAPGSCLGIRSRARCSRGCSASFNGAPGSCLGIPRRTSGALRGGAGFNGAPGSCLGILEANFQIESFELASMEPQVHAWGYGRRRSCGRRGARCFNGAPGSCLGILRQARRSPPDGTASMEPQVHAWGYWSSPTSTRRSSSRFNGAPGSCLGIPRPQRRDPRAAHPLQWSPRFMPGDTPSEAPVDCRPQHSFNGAPGSCLGIPAQQPPVKPLDILELQWSPRFMPGDTRGTQGDLIMGERASMEPQVHAWGYSVRATRRTLSEIRATFERVPLSAASERGASRAIRAAMAGSAREFIMNLTIRARPGLRRAPDCSKPSGLSRSGSREARG